MSSGPSIMPTPEPQSAAEWARRWDELERCPHIPPHDNGKEYPTAEAYEACLAAFFCAFAAQEGAKLQQRVEALEAAHPPIKNFKECPVCNETKAALRSGGTP